MSSNALELLPRFLDDLSSRLISAAAGWPPMPQDCLHWIECLIFNSFRQIDATYIHRTLPWILATPVHNVLHSSKVEFTAQEWPLLLLDVLNWSRMTSTYPGCPQLAKNDLYFSWMPSSAQEWPLLFQDVLNWSRMTFTSTGCHQLITNDLAGSKMTSTSTSWPSSIIPFSCWNWFIFTFKMFFWKNVWFSHRCKYILKKRINATNITRMNKEWRTLLWCL